MKFRIKKYENRVETRKTILGRNLRKKNLHGIVLKLSLKSKKYAINSFSLNSKNHLLTFATTCLGKSNLSRLFNFLFFSDCETFH